MLGWIIGLEPTAPRATTWCSNQLSYTHHMARLKRLELLAYCLEGSCSILLSYRRMKIARQTHRSPLDPKGKWSG